MDSPGEAMTLRGQIRFSGKPLPSFSNSPPWQRQPSPGPVAPPSEVSAAMRSDLSQRCHGDAPDATATC